MTIAAQGGERPCRRECLEITAIESGAFGEILHAGEGPLSARLEKPVRAGTRQRLHHAHAQSQSGLVLSTRLERAVPEAHANVYRSYLDSVRSCIPHQLRRRVEAHGLTVEKRAGESRRLMALEPRRVIYEQRETRRMRVMNDEIVSQKVMITLYL